MFRRMTPDRALIWTILGAYMLLPTLVSVDPPVAPPISKDGLAAISATLCVLFVLGDRFALLPSNRVGKFLMILFVLSPYVTALTNPDPVPIGLAGVLQGQSLYDGLHEMIGKILTILPFVLAYRYLGTEAGLEAITRALMVAGLIYAIPMLIEIRLSPQINVWVYGYFQHDFAQAMRAGGFRPFVFMPHGLWVAFFALMTSMSALTVFLSAPSAERPRYAAIALFLLVLLIGCKTLGVMIYAAVLTPLILFAPRRTQVLFAGVLAIVVATYPTLRGTGTIPIQDIADFAYSLSPDRAQSFMFRVQNEEALLAHAAERPWFGWGGFGRNQIFDPVTGQNLTVVDGTWIIILTINGWLGYVAKFGLLVMPLLMMAREAWLGKVGISRWSASLCLIYAANLIDLLPNGTLIPFTWLLCGALTGQAEELARIRRGEAAAPGTEGLAAQTKPIRRRTVI